MLTEFTCGVKYMLCMGRHKCDNVPYCVLVSTNMHMYQMQVLALSSFFKGSVFLGEMVRGGEGESPLRFVLGDVIMSKGINYRKRHLEARVSELYAVFASSGREGDDIHQKTQTAKSGLVLSVEPGIHFATKRYLNSSFVYMVRNNLSFPRPKPKGILFVPKYGKLRAGRNNAMCAWIMQPSVDLCVSVTIPVAARDSDVNTIAAGDSDVNVEIFCQRESKGFPKVSLKDIHPLLRLKDNIETKIISHYYQYGCSQFVVELSVKKKLINGEKLLLLDFVRFKGHSNKSNSLHDVRAVLRRCKRGNVLFRDVARSLLAG